jgi:histidine triad (HIT) family protein
MDNCIFCKIIKKELPANIVWENEEFISFLDIFPKVPGHTLVIPKKHEDYIFNLDDTTYLALLKHSKDIAVSLKKALNCQRVGVLVEGFAVSHTHVHLVPLNTPSDLERKSEKGNLEELNQVAEKIKREIERK